MQNTRSHHDLPATGQDIASRASRAGGAGRPNDPAGHKAGAADLALIPYHDERLRALELSVVQTATRHAAHAPYSPQAAPGSGTILSLAPPHEIRGLGRSPGARGCASRARSADCGAASAGKRWGSSGQKLGSAHRKWAFPEAATLFPRDDPGGQQLPTRAGKRRGKGKALTSPAHKLARAVYCMPKRDTAFELERVWRAYRSSAGGPGA